jgi:hypothetical protein
MQTLHRSLDIDIDILYPLVFTSTDLEFERLAEHGMGFRRLLSFSILYFVLG